MTKPKSKRELEADEMLKEFEDFLNAWSEKCKKKNMTGTYLASVNIALNGEKVMVLNSYYNCHAHMVEFYHLQKLKKLANRLMDGYFD